MEEQKAKSALQESKKGRVWATLAKKTQK